jgi:hypothetical protein
MERDAAGGEEISPTISAESTGLDALTGETEEQRRGWSLLDQAAPIRLLEIGLAIVCIILISATLILRVSSR